MDLKMIALFPVSAEEIYQAWLDSEKHSDMTGATAEIDALVGSDFSAWDNYISGKNLELIPNSTIIQCWRTSDFEENDPDSHLEIKLRNTDEGCELTLIHTNIPENQPDYEAGWKEYYIEPMKAYFS